MESELSQFGLKPAVIGRMHEVFAHFPEVRQVILYGSRANGNFKSGSDIDLCRVGEDLSTDDLLLPYKIDLSIRDHIDNTELLSHINRAGIAFYRRSKE